MFPEETEEQRRARRALLDRMDKLLGLVEAEIEYDAGRPVGPTLASCYTAVMANSGIPAPTILGGNLTALHGLVLDLQEAFTITPWIRLRSGNLVPEKVLSELAGRHGRVLPVRPSPKPLPPLGESDSLQAGGR